MTQNLIGLRKHLLLLQVYWTNGQLRSSVLAGLVVLLVLVSIHSHTWWFSCMLAHVAGPWLHPHQDSLGVFSCDPRSLREEVKMQHNSVACIIVVAIILAKASHMANPVCVCVCSSEIRI